MPIINKTDFENIEIPKRPDKMLLKFEETTKPLGQNFLINILQIKTLTQLRDELLPNLMSGELRVI